jgi:hypothetical protein
MELVNITYAGKGPTYQEYSSKDTNLVVSNFINSEFGAPEDTIEYVIYDSVGNFVDINYDATDYYPNSDKQNPTTKLYQSIILDPKADAASRGLNRGQLNISYNFTKNLFNSGYNSQYWIKEISKSRRELKLASQVISDGSILDGFNRYEAYVSTKNYFTDFYLNFGLNRFVIAINVSYITDETGAYLLIKLYEPLPIDFDVKSTLWIVDKIAESVSYDLDIQVQVDETENPNQLRGPNTKIKVSDRVAQTTGYYNYNDLFSSDLSSSIQQLNSYYEDKALEINVDFTDFSNFIHFSNAQERINNFEYKLGLIESYNDELYSSSLFTSMSAQTLTAITQSNSLIKAKIDNIISKFDLYEYYLYYSSGSKAWPKSTSTKPYALYSVTSSQAITWMTDMIASASFYDDTNKDLLTNTIPLYIQEDPSNQSYLTFVNMVGQHFDNIWLYYKDLSNRYVSNNDPYSGISLDVVADALRGLGTNLYTNTNISDNLYYSMFGMNPDGSLLPPTGSEKNITWVTSSIATIGPNQLDKEIYKRLYHNIPYLLKTKGTQRGLKALIACYGIPESILTVNEFGGYDRDEISGVFEINNQKIDYITSSLSMSALLSPYTTAQEYSTENRINTRDIEVGFSPANTINNNISASVGYFNIDALIGNPLDQYKENYPKLDEYRDNYFSTYTYDHSIWEYIRLIKYYNNSLFKMIRDFVPARANLSTGIIIKPHILERSKYARHEPDVTQHNNFSQSIDIAFITGSDGGAIKGSTSWSGSIMSPIGYVGVASTQGVEKYNGELSGSNIVVTNGEAFDQTEESYTVRNRPKVGNAYPWYASGSSETESFVESFLQAELAAERSDVVFYTATPYLEGILYTDPLLAGTVLDPFPNLYIGLNDGVGNEYVATITYTTGPEITSYTQTRFSNLDNIRVNYGALMHNVVNSVRSKRFLDLDYSYDQSVPVNLDIIKLAISESQVDNYATYTDPSKPYAQLQDSNYSLKSFTGIRYLGSSITTSSYSVANSIEDSFIGFNKAVDKIKTSFAYLVDIYTASLFFPGRSNAQIKYLISDEENVLDLTKANNNIFDIQNVYKSGETVNISLFKYDERNPYSQLLANNPTLKIYEGGFRYLPILHNLSGSTPNQSFTLDIPIQIIIAGLPGSSGANQGDPYLNASNWDVSMWVSETYLGVVTGSEGGGRSAEQSSIIVYASASYIGPSGPLPYSVTINVGTNLITIPGSVVPRIELLSSIGSIGGAISVSSGLTNGDYELLNGNFAPLQFTTSRYKLTADVTTALGLLDPIIDISSISFAGGGSAGTQPSRYYTSEVTSSQTCLFYLSGSNELIISGALAEYYYRQPIMNSPSDTSWNESIGLDRVILPFTVNIGDKISFYDSSSRLGWNDKFEYTIAGSSVQSSGSNHIISIKLSEQLDLSLVSQSASPVTIPIINEQTNLRLCRYIYWKHVPDETNVILKYNPKDSTIVEEGLLYPQYISGDLKNRSGNIIKSLKSQNLI